MKYIILKNFHYSLHLPKLYLGNKDSFCIIVKFTDSCRYNLKNNNQKDINKLFGVSYGYHKKNSIRIGWNYNIETDKIDIYRYEYNNSVRTTELINSFNINEDRLISLLLDKDSYIINTRDFSIKYNFRYPIIKIGYYLYPYFGGDEKAQKTTIINLEIY